MRKVAKNKPLSARRFGHHEKLEAKNLLAGDVFNIEPVDERDNSADPRLVGEQHDDDLGLIDYDVNQLPGTQVDAIDPLLRADQFGNQFFFDPAPDPELLQPQPVDVGAMGPYAARPLNVPIYHSNPSASKKIFLDFDGHVVSGTSWNQFNNGNPIHAPAYSLDGDVNNFSSTELSRIQDVYLRVAEDYAGFNVDVTTEDPGVALFAQGNQAIRTLISTDVDSNTGNQWFGGAGGVAYLNSWSWSGDTPVWVFENRLGTGAKNIAEAASHEVGHALSLSHDGNSSTTYYTGHGSGVTGWAPIMGVGYNRTLSQWSRGEYSNANNTEDDIARIATRLSFRNDDHGNDTNFSTATPAAISGVTLTGAGIIHNEDDVDVFSITLNGSGNISVSADAVQVGPNLDIELSVYDQNGSLVDSDNPTNNIDASVTLNGLSGGIYFVAIDGVGKGTTSNGYSDYGSIGQYTLSGTVQITGSNDAPTAAADNYDATEDTPLVVAAPGVLSNDTDPTNDPLEILLPLVDQPDHGTVSIETDGSFVYTPFVNFSGADSFEYMMTDGNGGVDTAVVTLTVAAENDAPISTDDAYSVQQGNVLTATAGVDDLLGNDSDEEGDDLQVNTDPVTQPSNGTVVLQEDGSFTYSANPGFHGADSFVYEVTDGNGGSAQATATIDVNPWGPNCGSPAPNGVLGDGSSDLIYNPVTGLMTFRMDNDFAGDEIIIITVVGPEPTDTSPPGAHNWTNSIYYSGRIELSSSQLFPLDSDVPLLQYAPGLTAADFNDCANLGTRGDTIFGGSNAPHNIFTHVTIATDTVAPTATADAADVTSTGASHTFDVTFNDDAAIEGSDIVTGVVRVTGPNGYDEIATVNSVTPAGNVGTVTASLTIPAAGGTWDVADEGTYSVSIVDFTVTDTSNNFLASGEVGTFNVDFGSISDPGDFDGDGDFDCDDVEVLSMAITSGSTDSIYDLDASGTVSVADLHYWVTDIKGTLLGDANLDFTVDGGDFLTWNTNKFQSGKTWCDGDFNGDGFVDGGDFLIWNQFKFQSPGVATPLAPNSDHPAGQDQIVVEDDHQLSSAQTKVPSRSISQTATRTSITARRAQQKEVERVAVDSLFAELGSL